MDKYDIIKEEIQNDPLSRGYSSMTEEEITNSLNIKDRTVTDPITSQELLMWAADNGRYTKIKRGADSFDLAGLSTELQSALAAQGIDNDKVKSVCWASLQMLGRDQTTLNLNEQKVVGMVTLLVTVGILDATDKQELEALAVATSTRGHELGVVKLGEVVYLGDVMKAKQIIDLEANG